MKKIAVDINQLSGTHAVSNEDQHEQIKRLGFEIVPVPLPFGDYAFLTDGMAETISRRGDKLKKMDLVGDIKIVVDTKKSLDEVAMNIQGKEHARFRDECILARKCGCRLAILICDEKIRRLDEVYTWKSKRKGAQTNSESLMKAMQTMSMKYGVWWFFCGHDEIGRYILLILRILKE